MVTGSEEGQRKPVHMKHEVISAKSAILRFYYFIVLQFEIDAL